MTKRQTDLPLEGQGLTPLGNLTTSGSIPPPSSGSHETTQPSRPTSSETTGSPNLARTPPKLTGQLLREIGFAKQWNSGQVDDTLKTVWLPQSVSTSLKPKTRWRKTDNGEESYTAGYTLVQRQGVKIWINEVEKSVEILTLLLEPTDKDACTKELARLKAVCVSRNQNMEDLRFQIAIMAEELSRYPIDVVRTTCRSWNSKWFPAIAELLPTCEEHVMLRRDLLHTLEQMLRQREARSHA